MAIERRFTAPIQVVVTPEVREAIASAAETEKVSMAQVVRDVLEGRRPPLLGGVQE